MQIILYDLVKGGLMLLYLVCCVHVCLFTAPSPCSQELQCYSGACTSRRLKTSCQSGSGPLECESKYFSVCVDVCINGAGPSHSISSELHGRVIHELRLIQRLLPSSILLRFRPVHHGSNGRLVRQTVNIGGQGHRQEFIVIDVLSGFTERLIDSVVFIHFLS